PPGPTRAGRPGSRPRPVRAVARARAHDARVDRLARRRSRGSRPGADPHAAQRVRLGGDRAGGAPRDRHPQRDRGRSARPTRHPFVAGRSWGNSAAERLGAIERREIEKAWNRMTALMGGKFNPSYTMRAKDNGWVDTPKTGHYALRSGWEKALGP